MYRLVICFFIVVSALCYGADYSEQLFEIMKLVEEKKYVEAIRGYEDFMKTAPKAIHGPVQFEIASLHAAAGNKDRALAMMQQAIQTGFDDCLAVERYEEWQGLKTDPRFKELHARIQVTDADLKEIFWLKSEIQHVNHDTKMMITENINRADTAITAIPQSQIPIRPTTSPGVLFNREVLKMMHQVQRYYVMESDKARMKHVGTMGVISGGISTEQVLESSRLADQAAEERKRAIDARKFSLPPAMDSTPRACTERN